MLTSVPVYSSEAHRLLEVWRLLAAARQGLLDITHHREACPDPATDKPCRLDRGWGISYQDCVGARIVGDRHITIDVFVPRERALEPELLRRQGPLTALVMEVAGFTPLHAVALQTPAGLVALAAPSGSGKSTLASLAQLDGWPVGGDDVLALDDDLTVLPLPGALRTDAPWAMAPGERGADGRFSIPLPPLPGGQRIKAMVTLRRGPFARLEPVRGAERLAILADASLAEFLPGREELTLHWAGTIPVHRLTVPRDLASLRSGWKTIRGLLAGACG
jgi:hypothetical protein